MTYTHTQEDSMSMLYRTVLFAMACSVGVVGCRDNGTLTPADLSMGTGGVGGGGGGGGGTGTGGMDMGPTYTVAGSIAAVRTGAGHGFYEVDDVVAIVRTPSSKSPKLIVQDEAGGKYSAIQLTCSGSSMTHPCSVQTTVTTLTLGHKVTIKGEYFKSGADKGGAETFYLASITDNGTMGTPPAALTMDQTAIARATDTTVQDWSASFWQKVTVTPTEDLVMYDWTPSDLKFTGTWSGCSTAPFVFGFGMIPTSANATATAACTSKTAAAPSQTTSDGKEVLIGTDYYKDFKVSSDCQCAQAPTQVPGATTKWPSGMAMTGILGYDVPSGSMVGHKYFSPTEAGVLTNLVAPPM
jgi:hypothetical protein